MESRTKRNGRDCSGSTFHAPHLSRANQFGFENRRNIASTASRLNRTKARIAETIGAVGRRGGVSRLARIASPMAKTSSAKNAQPYHPKNRSKYANVSPRRSGASQYSLLGRRRRSSPVLAIRRGSQNSTAKAG